MSALEWMFESQSSSSLSDCLTQLVLIWLPIMFLPSFPPVQINLNSTISNFGVAGLTAGVQTAFPGGADGKAHVSRPHSCYRTLLMFFIVRFSHDAPLMSQVTYHHDYAALHAKIHGFKAAPDLELSANLGNKKIFTGGSLLYNTESRNISMTKAGNVTAPLFPKIVQATSWLAHERLINIWFACKSENSKLLQSILWIYDSWAGLGILKLPKWLLIVAICRNLGIFNSAYESIANGSYCGSFTRSWDPKFLQSISE